MVGHKKSDVFSTQTHPLPIDSIYTYTWLQNASPISEITPFGPPCKILTLTFNKIFWSKQGIYIHYMKQIFRILIGLPLSPFVIILGTCVWICTDDEDWMEGVGTHAWYLASGQWNKLPE